MKNLQNGILVLIVCLLYLSCEKLVTHKQFYPDKKVLDEFQCIEGNPKFMKHGSYIFYYPSGEKWLEGEYKENILQEGVKCYSKSGSELEFQSQELKNNVIEFASYKKDDSGKLIKHGLSVKFYRTMPVWLESFTNGVVDGPIYGWQPSSVQTYSVNKKNGKYEGKELFWTPAGSLMRVANYKNDKLNGELIEYYNMDNSDEKKQELARDMLAPDESEDVSKNEKDSKKIKMKLNLKDGKKSGPCIVFSPKGDTLSLENFSDDILSGVVKYWDTKGDLYFSGEFTDGGISKTSKEWSHIPPKNLPKKSNKKLSGSWVAISKTEKGLVDYKVEKSIEEKPMQTEILLNFKSNKLKKCWRDPSGLRCMDFKYAFHKNWLVLDSNKEMCEKVTIKGDTLFLDEFDFQRNHSRLGGNWKFYSSREVYVRVGNSIPKRFKK